MNFGERGSGKSHSFGLVGKEENLVVKAIEYWFSKEKRHKIERRIYTLSCFELYEREITDLLHTGSSSSHGAKLSTIQLTSLAESVEAIMNAISKRKTLG